MSGEMAMDEPGEVRARNRIVLRVLLGIILALLIAGFYVGVRW